VLGFVLVSVIPLVSIYIFYIWSCMSRTQPDSMLLISIAALSLAFAPFAIPNESVPLLTRYYMGIALGGFGFLIRIFEVIEKSWRRHAKQRVGRAVAAVILIRTAIINLLFGFPVIVWIIVYTEDVHPDMMTFAFTYCTMPIAIALVAGLLEYKLLYA